MLNPRHYNGSSASPVYPNAHPTSALVELGFDKFEMGSSAFEFHMELNPEKTNQCLVNKCKIQSFLRSSDVHRLATTLVGQTGLFFDRKKILDILKRTARNSVR